jgi:hypothetical protein
MSVFEALAPVQPSAEQGALRVKRTVAQTFEQIEHSLSQVCHIMERHGPKEIEKALGKDSKEVKALYKALKTFVEEHKPDTSVSDMPS